MTQMAQDSNSANLYRNVENTLVGQDVAFIR
jgi:hypothetical protein